MQVTHVLNIVLAVALGLTLFVRFGDQSLPAQQQFQVHDITSDFGTMLTVPKFEDLLKIYEDCGSRELSITCP